MEVGGAVLRYVEKILDEAGARSELFVGEFKCRAFYLPLSLWGWESQPGFYTTGH